MVRPVVDIEQEYLSHQPLFVVDPPTPTTTRRHWTDKALGRLHTAPSWFMAGAVVLMSVVALMAVGHMH